MKGYWGLAEQSEDGEGVACFIVVEGRVPAYCRNESEMKPLSVKELLAAIKQLKPLSDELVMRCPDRCCKAVTGVYEETGLYTTVDDFCSEDSCEGGSGCSHGPPSVVLAPDN